MFKCFMYAFFDKLKDIMSALLGTNYNNPLMLAVRNKAAKKAEELCASGQCARALIPLQLAIFLGDLPSLALKAWLLMNDREGVVMDQKRGFELAEKGARLGCHHCQGVMAYCYRLGRGIRRDATRSLELARDSSVKGSRYGQITLGELHCLGEGGLAVDDTQAIAFFRLAASQGLDEAQYFLGCMYCNGFGVARDYTEALRWFKLAGVQGYPYALRGVTYCHQNFRVSVAVAEAISG